MGYRGKVRQREQARLLRGDGMTMQDIAQRLSVSKSSVSLWVHDVDFVPRPRVRARRREPNALQRRKQAEIDGLMADGVSRVGRLSERDFLVAGLALYAGEGSKGDGSVRVANTNPHIIAFFCAWLRHFYEIDEARLRVRLYYTKGSTLRRQFATGHVSPGSRQPSSARRTAPYPTRRSGLPSTSMVSCQSATVAPGHTGASWVWCTHCSAAQPFRGSSIGRAVGR
jgi:transcriptional regulator with XRE-family HTH domain